MPKIIAKDRNQQVVEFEAVTGTSLMEALRDTAGMDVAAICGGACSCATCHVYIAPSWLDKLPEQQTDELELVEFLDAYRENSRLSCQIPITDALAGLEVELAPET